mgnify:CR=1 FL=1
MTEKRGKPDVEVIPREAPGELQEEPPVVARLVVEIRSDGSRTIARILPSSLSPASVRNVMMDLEDAGLIFSPHTSAGRVPTEQGQCVRATELVVDQGARPQTPRAPSRAAEA